MIFRDILDVVVIATIGFAIGVSLLANDSADVADIWLLAKIVRDVFLTAGVTYYFAKGWRS